MTVPAGEESPNPGAYYAGYGGYGPPPEEVRGSAYGSKGVPVETDVIQDNLRAAAVAAMEEAEFKQKSNLVAAQKSALAQQQNPLTKNRQIRFNPPVIRYASGAPVGIESPEDRRLIFTDLSQRERVIRKGYVIPDVSFAENDWAIQSGEGIDPSSSAFDYTKSDYPFESFQGTSGVTIYGFKFMYNPAVIDFGISSTDGVNLGYIASGKATAMPIGATQTGSGISLSFPITRVDDMSLIESRKVKVRNEHYQRAVDKWFQGGQVGRRPRPEDIVNKTTLNDVRWMYGRRGESAVTEDDLEMIVKRGTMYDLEFLFRAVLGRRWKTAYRGFTADVGLMFGVPLKLVLSREMIYRVRLSNVSYSHKSFTPDMVPMYTDVSLTFDRIPDVVGFA